MRTEPKLLKPLPQVVAVSLTLFVGWSRIADNKHFLTDVLVGFALGAIFFAMHTINDRLSAAELI